MIITSPGRASLLSLAVAGALAGCTSEPGALPGAEADAGPAVECADQTAVEFPEAGFAGPAEVPVDVACAPGGLAGADLGGRWQLSTDDPFEFSFPLIRDDCAAGLAVDDGGFGELLAFRDDTDLFWQSLYVDEDFRYVIASHACVDAATGELEVAAAACVNDDCRLREGQLRRFERPAGEGDADGLELVAAWSGGDAPWPPGLTFAAQVLGDLAFVAREGDLRIVDVADPTAPRDRGVFLSEEEYPRYDFNDVKAFAVGGVPYAILAGEVVRIVDARDPDLPIQAGVIDEYAHTVFVRTEGERTLAYLGNYQADVPIFDVTDPTHPTLVDRVALPQHTEVHDLFATADHLYVNGTTRGFLVLAADGDGWTLEGETAASYSHASWVGTIGDRTVAIHGDEGRGAHLRVIDVDPASPTFMGDLASYQTRPEVSIHNMELVGDKAYVAYYQDGVRVLDLSDPTAPTLAAYAHTFDLATGPTGPFNGAFGVDFDPATGLIFVADGTRGLMIFRETD